MGKAIVVKDIRSQRNSPGIRAQHLAAVEAVGKVCGAEVSGCEVGSKEIEFVPGEIVSGKVKVKISTAGSVGLVLQAVLPVYLLSGKIAVVEITGGGTAGKWSPPVDYMDHVFLGILRKYGADVSVEIQKHGFYPKGGAAVVVKVGSSKINRLEIMENGNSNGIRGISVASKELEKVRVAERQKMAAMKELEGAKIVEKYVETQSIGSYLLLWKEFEKTVVGADVLGERGLKSEVIGKRCADLLKSRNIVDEHAADNLIPYIAFAGGNLACSRKTEHIKNNIKTCSKFGLDVKMENGVISNESA
jgi:RNA 3'-terminal phosphate cyclase (ATP)/RNA 3'-terminal phosphate cyclase (GTP)